jgi:mannose-1-phosphate guanylyltransferase
MRNTGPALGCLVKYIQEYHICDEDQKCIVFPSDHILSIDAFNRSLALAEPFVASNIVTFGVYPKHPETEYGYIIEGTNHKIDKFIEKPPYDVAKQLINDPMCYWNSGLYYSKISFLTGEYLNKCKPLSQIHISECHLDEDHVMHVTIDPETYQLCSNIPFDKLIMETTQNGCIVPFRGLWSDIGSWETIYQVSQQYKSVDCHELDTKNCHIFNYNQKQMVALVGVEDMCVINTKDAVLISKLSESNKVKDLAQLLEDQHVQKQSLNKPMKYIESLGINVSILFMIMSSYLRMDLGKNHK